MFSDKGKYSTFTHSHSNTNKYSKKSQYSMYTHGMTCKNCKQNPVFNVHVHTAPVNIGEKPVFNVHTFTLQHL